MNYETYYWGMNLIWWGVWFVFLFWIFAVPFDIPFQRTRRETAIDILQKRLANGHITPHEYANIMDSLEAKPKKK